eukprot:gb/GEZN01010357.1/.p1 GENE.gb/GEZN01010357.1/~~gb/GEZN01010357.1/.p1  ORF type:complete len:316 (-),score=61.74 gb/GEZN01010357.1/:203-1150(-)
MNVVREIEKANLEELKMGIIGGDSASWHDTYKNSAYVFVGGLDYRLTEGDVLAVMSQFGEIVDLNLCRNKETGKSKGFCFLAYEDQRSSILAVDNMNGSKLMKRTLRVDHTEQYRRPKKKVKDKDGKEIEVSDSDEEDYDTRRKRIWNYEAYNTQAVGLAGERDDGDRVAMPQSLLQHPTHLMPSAGSAEDKRVKRIMEMMEKRKRERADRKFQDNLLEEKKKRGEKLPFKGQFWGAALSSMSAGRAPVQTSQPSSSSSGASTVLEGGKGDKGDRLRKEKTGKSERDHDRDRDRNRQSRRSRSRSRSRSRGRRRR